MYANEQHTAHDLAHFTARGIDPATREPRKQAVPCFWCPIGAASTMNRSGLCDRHDTLIRDALAEVDTGSNPGDRREQTQVEAPFTPRG